MSTLEELKIEAEPITEYYLLQVAEILRLTARFPDGRFVGSYRGRLPPEYDLAERLGLVTNGGMLSNHLENEYCVTQLTERGRQVYKQLEAEGVYERLNDLHSEVSSRQRVYHDPSLTKRR